MGILLEMSERLRKHVDRRRLVETARKLIAAPSPTGQAGEAADCLAALLQAEGFPVERAEAGHPAAPAVLVRWESRRPGRCLQLNGHLDTVHLPFVPPGSDGTVLTGSGAADMKGGLAAAVEAVRVLRAADALTAGSVLLTAHDLHEAPWGEGRQLDALIAAGQVGDAVLLPEPLHDRLPVVGRGAATWKVVLRRPGQPVHEVMRPADEPSVIGAGAALVSKLEDLQAELSARPDPQAGGESVFIGQIHAGEIYNQYPQECWLEGTRRWLPATTREAVEREFRELVGAVARETGTGAEVDFRFIRGAFVLDREDPLVAAFRRCYQLLGGAPLPEGPKPFVDDGNSFWDLARLPAITHGPRAGGQHTTREWVSIDDLVRVAHLYALTAALYCDPGQAPVL